MRINVFDSWLTRATDNGGVERRVGERHVRSERDDTGAVRCGNAGAAAAAGAGAAGADAGTAGAQLTLAQSVPTRAQPVPTQGQPVPTV